MSNYLKKILFVILLSIMPFMNGVSNAMENEAEEFNTTCRLRIVNADQNDSSSFEKQSTFSEIVEAEDSQPSFTSYLSSLVNNATEDTFKFVDYARCRPRGALIMGLVWACQMTTVASLCYCACLPNPTHKMCTYLGPFPDNTSCINNCRGTHGMQGICTSTS